MPALAHDPLPRHVPRSAPARARLRAVPPPSRRRRLPSARAVAAYALGLTLGFLLLAPASVPGGAEVVAGQLRLAALCGIVAVAAALRSRAVARRRARLPARAM